jgi:hypothetical protein
MKAMRMICLLLMFFCAVIPTAVAMDEMTVYVLLAPDSHQFAIRYDVSATEQGSKVFFNIIRPGSEATDEKVLDRASGKELTFVMTDGKEARASGQADPTITDDTRFIKIVLPHPVPKDGEYRLRIYKTYKDAKSYYSEGDRIIFDRSLGVKRNIILLPKSYELISSSVPVIVSTEQDGRVKVSMVNDRNDELGVKIVGRKLPMEGDKK